MAGLGFVRPTTVLSSGVRLGLFVCSGQPPVQKFGCYPRSNLSTAFLNGPYNPLIFEKTKFPKTPTHSILPLRHSSYGPSTEHPVLSDQTIDVKYENGLPVITVPLPSRKERCQFTLKPVNNNLDDFICFMEQEDGGIDRVVAYKPDGSRVARSTPIEVLLRSDFSLVINDQEYKVTPPEAEGLTSEHAKNISDLKNLVQNLYIQLNVEDHQLEREKALIAKLENLKLQMEPLEKVKQDLEMKAQRRTNILSWASLGFMGLQFGVLARLTWWEYSWDIMEPVTYFITYGTGMVFVAYYVCTKIEYNFEQVHDREFLRSLHRFAKQRKLDVGKYNRIKESIAETEYDLKRLRDPLQLNLPIQQLSLKR